MFTVIQCLRSIICIRTSTRQSEKGYGCTINLILLMFRKHFTLQCVYPHFHNSSYEFWLDMIRRVELAVDVQHLVVLLRLSWVHYATSMEINNMLVLSLFSTLFFVALVYFPIGPVPLSFAISELTLLVEKMELHVNYFAIENQYMFDSHFHRSMKLV